MDTNDDVGNMLLRRLREAVAKLTGRGGAFGDDALRPAVTKEATEDGCDNAVADDAESDDATSSGNPAPPAQERDWPDDRWFVEGQPDSYPSVARIDGYVYPGDEVNGMEWDMPPWPLKLAGATSYRMADEKTVAQCCYAFARRYGCESFGEWWADPYWHEDWIRSIERARREEGSERERERRERRHDALKKGIRGDDLPGNNTQMPRGHLRGPGFPGDDDDSLLGAPVRPRGGGRR